MPPRKKSAPAKAKCAPRAAYDLGVEDYRHDESKRVNNPPAALASYEKVFREKPKQSYTYDPHLSPQLVWAGKAGLMLILEVKGLETEDGRAKYTTARRWAKAVTHWGEMGRWEFAVVHDPSETPAALSAFGGVKL